MKKTLSLICTMLALLSANAAKPNFVVIMAELALITPPIGANVFIMRQVAPDVPMEEIFRGVFPFVIGELLVLALLILFPGLALWLVDQMG